MTVHEVCIDTVRGALAAEQGGAQRLELCADLGQGGTTPSAGAMRTVREHCRLPLMVLIRPRAGDFCYDRLEQAVMQDDVRRARDAGVHGVVLGALTADGSVDMDVLSDLIQLAGPLELCFHRAFDLACDAEQALEDLVQLGLRRVLTSGQQPTAPQGAARIRELISQAAGRLVVMPGGGIREHNIHQLLTDTKAREVHFTARALVTGARPAGAQALSMGRDRPGDACQWYETDAGLVRRMLAAGAGL